MSSPAPSKWLALLRQRCPRCCDGKIYERGMKMHERCPICNLRFEREPGYFIGSLYISYGAATIFLIIGFFIGSWLLPDWSAGWLVLLAGAVFVPFVPMVTRYSRVIWIFFDRWLWPSPPGADD